MTWTSCGTFPKRISTSSHTISWGSLGIVPRITLIFVIPKVFVDGCVLLISHHPASGRPTRTRQLCQHNMYPSFCFCFLLLFSYSYSSCNAVSGFQTPSYAAPDRGRSHAYRRSDASHHHHPRGGPRTCVYAAPACCC